MSLSENFKKYLTAINNISNAGNIVTNSSLADYLGEVSYKTPMDFFNRNNYLRKFVNINKNKKITTYSLTKKGKDAITLMEYFKEYYHSL